MWTRQPERRSSGLTFGYGVRVSQQQQPPSDFSVALSRHLCDYMQEKDLSAARLATAMGRSRQYVYDHTNGQRPPDTDLINTVARLTGTDSRSLMMILMGRMGQEPNPPAFVEQQRRRWRHHPGKAAKDDDSH